MEGRCEVHVEQAPQVFRLVTKDEAIDADAGIVHQELQPVQFLGDSSAALARALCQTATRDLQPRPHRADREFDWEHVRATGGRVLVAASGKSGTLRTSTSNVCSS